MSVFQTRVKNLLNLFKFRINENRNKVISFFLSIIIVFSFINIVPKNLRIYFIDVGQGDSSLIVTPLNKTILIDGGGNEFGNYNIGKNVLLPYLLDRGIKDIDYVIVSHFDSDHFEGIQYLMEEIKIKVVIIGTQFDGSENYEKFLDIVKRKKIKVEMVKEGERINIEKNVYFDVLWPQEERSITNNSINNNALVCKLNYKNFSALFTGDIEEEAEKILLSKYDEKILNSKVLKVAHHGSKSSSTEEFLEAVNPTVALIGVGKNNRYNHPYKEVLDRMENLRSKNL